MCPRPYAPCRAHDSPLSLVNGGTKHTHAFSREACDLVLAGPQKADDSWADGRRLVLLTRALDEGELLYHGRGAGRPRK